MENKLFEENGQQEQDHMTHECHDGCCENTIDHNPLEIRLDLSNGESYAVNSNAINWESMCDELEDIKKNITQIQRMLFDIVSTKSDSVIDVVIDTLNTFTNGFGVNLDYSNMREDISKYEIAMLMCFDSSNIVNTMINHITMYDMINKINDSSNEETHLVELMDLLSSIQSIGEDVPEEYNDNDTHEEENDNENS